MTTTTTPNITKYPSASRRRWRLPKRWYIHALLWIACILVGFPLLYAMLLATQNNTDIFAYRLTPGEQLWANLKFVMVNRSMGTFMLNSAVQAIIITVGKTVISLLAGLAFVYFRFPGKWIIFGFVLITLMMPTDIMILALFRVVSGLGWGSTLYAITIPFLASATGSFLFRQHFSNIPAELSEAAQLDGANPLQFLFRILLPMSWNVIGALAIIEILYVWNMYLWPLIIMREQDKQVVQIGLSAFTNTDVGVGYGPMMLATVIVTIPPIVAFILLQKSFMSGFQVTSEK